MAKAKKIPSVPFRGGVDTARERMLLDGQYSKLQNWRQRHPGLEQRKGQIKHHTTADGTNETTALFQFTKANKSELHLFRQMSDGSLQEATDDPPTVTTGAYGSDVLTAAAGSIPASFAVIDDMMIYADKVRQHQIYTGSAERVLAFIVYKGAATIPAIPVIGEDYSDEVTDGQSGTVAILDSLGTLAAFDALYVCTPVPTQAINFTVTAANGTASVLQAKYWKGTYAAVSGISDGTDVSGDSMAQTGAVTWTAPTDELPHYQFGRSGYWYQLSLASGAMDSEVEVSEVSFDGPWQDIANVWDGVLVDPAEAQVYRDATNDGATEGYQVYGSASVFIGNLTTSDFAYWSSIDPLSGVYLDAGSTPNIIKAVAVGSSNISFFSSGSATSRDWIEVRDANLLQEGFEVGQSFAITGTSNNNLTTQALAVSSTTIWVEPGVLTTETDQSATLTFDANAMTLDNIEVWTGAAWAAVTGMIDSTEGLTKSGFVTWDRTSQTPQRTQFNQSQHMGYWYRMSFDDKLSNSVNISIQNMPYFVISKWGLGRCNGVWKERAMYTFDLFPNHIHVSAKYSPLALNGVDWTILEPGDGRSNAVLAMENHYAEMIVWQEEKGEKGGCTTLFEGFNPSTFNKFIISNRIGILNRNCSDVVDGVLTSTETDEEIKTLAYWISREGVFVTEGTTASAISDDIQDLFDPTITNSIRKGYEDKHFLFHDKAENVLRLGLVTGASATIPNIFPVYDLADKTWSFDTLGQALSCANNIDAASGDIPVLQIGGGALDGFVYQLNNTDNDVSTAIDSELVIELDGKGEKIQIEEETIRMKVLASGDITQTMARDGSATYENSRTLSMTADTAGAASGALHRRHRINPNVPRGDHLSLKLRNNVASIRPYLLDIGLKVSGIDNNS